MYKLNVVYKIQTKDNLFFTAKILEEDISAIRIVSVVDQKEDIISKDNIKKARIKNQENTGDKYGRQNT